MDSNGSWNEPMADFSEHGDESSDFKITGNFITSFG
jgi:hypothetical protein